QMVNFNLQGGNTQFDENSPEVQAVAAGRMKIGDVITPRTPLPARKRFLAAVMNVNPQFNSADFDIEKGVRKAFTSGSYSQNLNAINTAREHMGTFFKSAQELNNGSVRALNALGNALSLQFGSDKVSNFNIAKQFFSGEV